MRNIYLSFLLCVFAFCASAQPVFNWTSQEIKAGRNLQKMTVSNNQAVVAGFGRSFVKSTDNGSTWNDIGILTPEFDFLDMQGKGNTGYLVSRRAKLYDALPDVYSNGFILLTGNGGDTWEVLSLAGFGTSDDPALDPSTPVCFGHDFSSVCCVNDSVIYCSLQWYAYDTTQASLVKSYAGIFKSTNKGVTWKNLKSNLSSGATVLVAYDSIVYAGGNKFLYKTTVRLDTLQDLLPRLNTSGAGYVNGIQAVSKDEVYVITSTNGIFRSIDGGAIFTKYNVSGVTGGNDFYFAGDNTLLIVGSSGKSRISNDGGTTWKDAGLNVAAWEVGKTVNDSLYVLTKGDVYKIKVADLKAGNMTWVKQTVGDDNIHKMVVFNSGKTFLAGLGQTFKVSTNNGKTWNDAVLPAVPRYDESMDFNGLRNIKDTAVACMNRFYLINYTEDTKTDLYFQGAIFKTTDNWKTWSNLDVALIGKDEGNDPSKNPQLPKCNGLNTSIIEYAGNNVVLVWARWYDISTAAKPEHSRVFRSADGGKNWKVVSDDYSTFVQDIRFRGDTGYISGNKILLKSVDRGLTYTDLYPALKTAAGSDQFIYLVTIGPGKEIFVTTTTAVFRSTDGGNSFVKVNGTTGGNDFYRLDENSWIVMGSTTKSLMTNNAGTNWTNASAGATIYEIGGVWNEYLYALGQGKIYRTPVATLDLGTRAEMIPVENSLAIIYKPSAVELVSRDKAIDRCLVYAITGQVVASATPRSTRCEFSYHSFTPGVYITRALAGGKLFVNKIVIP